MEWRLDTELDLEPDYPPEWWDLMLDEEFCPCGAELSKQDIDTDQEVCEDCR